MTKQNLNQDAERQIKSLEDVIRTIREHGPYGSMLFVGVAGANTDGTRCSIHRDGTKPVHSADVLYLTARLRAEACELEELVFRD
ncbi:hypothetical protein [Eikenella sp. HMSC061C02]|jgi:hypothetical protein|uniref:hypothetical protein n=1 Tax=Eikenella sp. HMSC061C02 TaxID=1715021 RepID=UPI0008A4FF8E|nr:hypothetical protein [Eikenella sp. HMSC061C02]OFN60578.1 hypothetical protein HMPREF2541_07715 [Eikenella sp. HMSC061C02]